MKRISCITIIILFFFTVNAQENNKITSDSLKVEHLDQKVDSLLKLQNDLKLEILDKRIEQATETINNQTSIISSFGTLYTIITIILALLGIALPILTYQFGIKPSQKALEEFEKTSKNKFDKYLIDKKNEEINNAIEDLKSEDLSIKNNALSFLALNYHLKFSDDQIKEILKIVKNDKIDENSRNQIEHSLSYQKNKLVKKYFLDYLNSVKKVDNTIYHCIKFLINYPYNEYREDLATYFNNNDSVFMIVAMYFSQLSRKDLLKILNDKKLIQNFSDKSLAHIKAIYKGYLKNFKMTEEEFENTLLGERLNTYS